MPVAMMMVLRMMMMLLLLLLLLLLITDPTHRALRPGPACRGRRTRLPRGPDLKVNLSFLLRPNMPDRMRPMRPNSSTCQPKCRLEGGGEARSEGGKEGNEGMQRGGRE